jgi:hypothetical protein
MTDFNSTGAPLPLAPSNVFVSALDDRSRHAHPGGCFMIFRKLSLTTLAAFGGVLTASAQAQTAAPADATAAPAAPAAWADTMTIHGSIEAGFTINPDGPDNGLNFGQLFTDKANVPLVNQALLTFERPLDPKAEGDDYGFKIQGMFGTDARYTHFLGEFDRTIHDRYQFDIVEANFLAHFAALTDGGVDIKLGQYSTPIGFEVIDATLNPFYSHSYIFNFGIPLKHTGGYATFHVSDTLDIYAGGDTGVNTSLFHGDNNGVPAFLGGIGVNNLLDGKLTILALTHIGAENASNVIPDADHQIRWINDIVATYKADDKNTFVGEFNYIKDDGFHAQGYGAAGYVIHTIDDNLSVAGRAEVWRDANNFFVGAFKNPLDFVDVEKGLPASGFVGNTEKSTYSEVTLGLTYKPDVPDAITGTMIRPELRYDRVLAGGQPYDTGTAKGQVTLAFDIVVPF